MKLCELRTTMPESFRSLGKFSGGYSVCIDPKRLTAEAQRAPSKEFFD